MIVNSLQKLVHDLDALAEALTSHHGGNTT